MNNFEDLNELINRGILDQHNAEKIYQLKNKSIINKQPYINFDLNNDRINIIS